MEQGIARRAAPKRARTVLSIISSRLYCSRALARPRQAWRQLSPSGSGNKKRQSTASFSELALAQSSDGRAHGPAKKKLLKLIYIVCAQPSGVFWCDIMESQR